MRHRKVDKPMGRSKAHRAALEAALICGLITDKRIKTTLPKARVARRAAEKMVTLARKGTLSARRAVLSSLHREVCVRELFDGILPKIQGRKGGYTRIIKLGSRGGDGAEVALLEWVDVAAPVKVAKTEDATEAKGK
jgi:large subunit ribosomal protein L17